MKKKSTPWILPVALVAVVGGVLAMSRNRPLVGTPEEIGEEMKKRHEAKLAETARKTDAAKNVAGDVASKLGEKKAPEPAKPRPFVKNAGQPMIFRDKPVKMVVTPNDSAPSGQWYRENARLPENK